MNLSKNFFWQAIGQGGGKGLGLLFYLLLPRFVGIEVYGQFSFALSLALMVLQPILELGLDLVITKWVSRDRDEVIQQALIVRIITAILCLAILPILAHLGAPLSLLIMLYAYLVLISAQRICFAIQRGREQMRLEGIATFLQKGLAIVGLVVFHFINLSPLWIAPSALVTSTAIVTFYVVYLTQIQITKTLWKPIDIHGLQAVAQEGFLLGGVSLFGMIYFRVDSVMLGLLVSDVEVGQYNLAYKIIEGAIFLPSLIMAVTFPGLSKSAKFQALFKKLFLILGVSGFIFGAFIFGFAPNLMSIAYGSEFQAQAPILRLLALTLFPVYWGHLATQALVALDRQKLYLFLTILAVITNVGLNLWLIPLRGARGAAISTLVTEILITLCCFCSIWYIQQKSSNSQQL